MTKNTHKRIKKHNKTRKLETKKHKKQFRQLPNRTPYNINERSEIIFENAPKELPPLANSVAILEQNNGPASYSPTVNKELVTVSCKRSRNTSFETFSFKVNKAGLPQVEGNLYDVLKGVF